VWYDVPSRVGLKATNFHITSLVQSISRLWRHEIAKLIYSPKLRILLGARRLPSKAQEENHQKFLNLTAALISMTSLEKKKNRSLAGY